LRSVYIACPARSSRTVCPWESPLMETQLRDVAVLATIALLIVLTLQVLWLTGDRHHRDRDR